MDGSDAGVPRLGPSEDSLANLLATRQRRRSLDENAATSRVPEMVWESREAPTRLRDELDRALGEITKEAVQALALLTCQGGTREPASVERIGGHLASAARALSVAEVAHTVLRVADEQRSA